MGLLGAGNRMEDIEGWPLWAELGDIRGRGSYAKNLVWKKEVPGGETP